LVGPSLLTQQTVALCSATALDQTSIRSARVKVELACAAQAAGPTMDARAV
jgi:hypothetical protein